MKLYLSALAFLIFVGCKTPQNIGSRNDQQFELTIVQVNDVYEIAPLSGGLYGGLARVATIKKDELKKNGNTLLVMAGDFLSPSVYNSLKYQGKRIRGRQMVDAMNAAKFDLAIFGNHEFDITRAELEERLNESDFSWVSSNTFLKSGDTITAFETNGIDIPTTRVIHLKDADGTVAKIGFLGITLPTTTANYVHYADPLATARLMYSRLRDSCDAVIAITHQAVKDDILLAKALPELTLIVGGHEHDMRFEQIGNVYITKAHANAKSAFLIKVKINKRDRSVTVAKPFLQMIDSTVAHDSATSAVVNTWVTRANENYASLGFDPLKIIMTQGDSLEGREIYTRDTTTNLTELIVRAMQFAAPQADVVIYNAGSIRLDDILFPPVSQYDILRTLPFGGSIKEVDMTGKLLSQIIAAGRENKGAGGFLHFSDPGQIDSARTYRVAVPDFLLTGGETNLSFLTPQNPLILKIYPEAVLPADPRSDIRQAIVQYLTK